MDGGYQAPKLVELGSLDELTRSYDTHKTQGGGDFIISNGVPRSFSPAS